MGDKIKNYQVMATAVEITCVTADSIGILTREGKLIAWGPDKDIATWNKVEPKNSAPPHARSGPTGA